jgi:integrase/recombinase XerD
MSALGGHMADYLRLRRALGYKLKRPGEELPQFVAFLDAAGAQTITVDIAVAWAQLSEGAQPITLAKRLGAVRGFAKYLATIDPATEIPPTGILGSRHRRPAPYLYSDAEVSRLLQAARQLRPQLRAATYEALFGLLAASGIRVGEAIALTRADVDLTAGIVTIRHAKFDRSRLVPLHPSVTEELRAYASCRDRLCPAPKSDTFFLAGIGGKALTYKGVHYAFTQLSTATRLRTETSTPLIHGLRHSFAVNTLIDLQREGVDVASGLTELSTYLGHVSPASTYWYLTAVPELMQLAATRLDNRFGGQR